MSAPWWLDEHAYAGQEHLDPTYVARYERKAGFDPGEDLEVLQRHGLDADSTVLDLGAGTGTFAIAVARPLPACRRGRRVAGHDDDASTSGCRPRRSRT